MNKLGAVVTATIIVPFAATFGAIIGDPDLDDDCDPTGLVRVREDLPDSVGRWGTKKVQVAAQIVSAAHAVEGTTRRDQEIAVMVGMGESGLRAIDYGDWETRGVRNPDGTPTSSIGVFQQQKWWGTVEQRMDPYQSAQLFYRAMVKKRPNREVMDPWQVAFDVQVGGSPSYYKQFWSDAQQMVAAIAVNPSTQSTGAWTVPLGAKYTMSSPFGMRIHPISGGWKPHYGQDMSAKAGVPVIAASAGTVRTAQKRDAGGYGKYVVIEHANGITTLYGHLSEVNVNARQSVTTGELIGRVGTTGASTGNHLHFETRVNGNAQDPVKFMSTRGVTLDGSPGSATSNQCTPALREGGT